MTIMAVRVISTTINLSIPPKYKRSKMGVTIGMAKMKKKIVE
jgi:hypothetical protein